MRINNNKNVDMLITTNYVSKILIGEKGEGVDIKFYYNCDQTEKLQFCFILKRSL